jgi:mRNA interferase RelE/StbE
VTYPVDFFKKLDTWQYSGYNIARMRYDIILSPEANEDFKNLSAHEKATIRDLIEVHLRHEPTKTSKSRIKRLRGLSRPQYRLRIDEFRVFYDVGVNTVEVLAIITKSAAAGWLKKAGE